MKRLFLALSALLLSAAAQAATFADATGSYTLTLQSDRGEELLSVNFGQPEDVSEATTGAGATASFTSPAATGPVSTWITGTGPYPLLPGSIMADANVTGPAPGMAKASGVYDTVLRLANWGASVETVTLTLSYELAITTAVDPAHNGRAAAAIDLVMQRDGATLLDEGLHADIDEFGIGAAKTNVFTTVFTVMPTNDVSTEIRLSLSGGALAQVAAVPLPAGGLLLVSGLALVALRRRR